MVRARVEQAADFRQRIVEITEVHAMCWANGNAGGVEADLGGTNQLGAKYEDLAAIEAGAYGAKMIGELINVAVGPAIANAVYNAIGVRLRQLPMTPAAVLAVLGRIPRGS